MENKKRMFGGYVSLNYEITLPIWPRFFQSKPEEVEVAVATALDAGYRLIDTALAYQNEQQIGNVLNKYIAEGKLQREELFITTKVSLTN